jgi:2'-5' RNA ligase
VLWLGVTEGLDVLARLAAAVEERTEPLGHVPETRSFRPHVTIARLRTPSDVRRTIAAIGSDAIGPAWDVEGVTVYESRRDADGARYVERATIALPG